MALVASKVLQALEQRGPVGKPDGRGNIKVLCPFHDDRDPSLSYNPDKGVFRCFTCDARGTDRALAEKLGLQPGPLSVEDLATARGLPVDWLSKLVRQAKDGVEIPYLNEKGAEVAVRVRKNLVKADKDQRFSWRRERGKPTLYGLAYLEAQKVRGYTVVVEGESDCWALWFKGYSAIGVPGATSWKPQWARYFGGFERVYLWREPDSAGARFLWSVAKDLPELLVIEPPPGVKDPGVLYKREPAAFASAFEGLREGARPAADILPQIVEAEGWSEDGPVIEDTPQYRVHQGQFCRFCERDRRLTPLCNFTAHITDELEIDDGMETTRQFRIQGKLANGQPLPAIDVPAASFMDMSWVPRKWGARPVIYAGNGTRDHLRTILQLQSARNGLQTRQVFTHTGWREINGRRAFLTASGALGAPDVKVAIEGSLEPYQLPLDPSEVDVKQAIAASLDMLKLGRGDVTWPLWAAMYLAPLCDLLDKGGCAPAFTLWLQGRSGALKSTMVALGLSHFGSFQFDTLPATWKDTPKSLERLLALAKDVPLGLDDWAPASTTAEMRELEQAAQAVIRGQGNRTGRGRLRTSLTERRRFNSRSLPISTGEQLPAGESILSRLYICDCERDDIALTALKACQAQQHLYRYSMAHFILWVRDEWDYLAEYLPRYWTESRDRAITESVHLRLPAACAWLQCGLYTALRFANEAGVLSDDQAAPMLEQGWDIFLTGAMRQASRVDTERPASRFLSMLRSLLIQQKVYFVPKETKELGESKPNHECIGWEWEDKGQKYLGMLPAIIHRLVYEEYNRAGNPLTYKAPAIWADLKRLQFTLYTDEDRTDYQLRVGQGENTSRWRVIALKHKALQADKTRDETQEAMSL